MVTLAFNAHWSDFLSGTLLFSSGLRFRSNDHSLKLACSLRPCSSLTARGPYMLGAREAPEGILGSLGSPRGYASVCNHFQKLTLLLLPVRRLSFIYMLPILKVSGTGNNVLRNNRSAQARLSSRRRLPFTVYAAILKRHKTIQDFICGRHLIRMN